MFGIFRMIKSRAWKKDSRFKKKKNDNDCSRLRKMLIKTTIVINLTQIHELYVTAGNERFELLTYTAIENRFLSCLIFTLTHISRYNDDRVGYNRDDYATANHYDPEPPNRKYVGTAAIKRFFLTIVTANAIQTLPAFNSRWYARSARGGGQGYTRMAFGFRLNPPIIKEVKRGGGETITGRKNYCQMVF